MSTPKINVINILFNLLVLFILSGLILIVGTVLHALVFSN